MSNSEVIENEKGYLLYKNVESSNTSTDSPYLIAKIRDLKAQYLGINYVTYRCGLKLFALKKELFTTDLPFNFVATIFQRHGFHQPDDCPVIKPFQLTALIHDIFFAAEKLGYYSDRMDFVLDHNCALVSTFLWNLFDPKRSTPLSVLEAKLTFLLLCDVVSFEQVVNEHFLLVADHNQCVSRVRFESMLAVLAKICAYLDDSDQFEAKLAHQIAHVCFEDIPGLVGLNENQFGGVWRSARCSGFMVYANILRLVQRLKQAQSVVHQLQCAGCQATPIQGMYFRCQRCRNCNICLRCFSHGFNNRKHNIHHRMYEISSCHAPTRRLATFLAKLCSMFGDGSDKALTTAHPENLVQDSQQIVEQNIEVLQAVDNPEVTAVRRHSTIRQRGNKSIYSTIAGNSTMGQHLSLMEKLSTVIDLLEEEQAVFTQRTAGVDEKLQKYFESHRMVVEAQIGKLKDIYRSNLTSVLPYSSTPYRAAGATKRRQPLQMIDIDIGPTSPTISKSIHGAEVNKSYLEANKSDYSLADISSWLQTRQSYYARKKFAINNPIEEATVPAQSGVDEKMLYFKQLLNKVKEIIDDSYSDNSQLAKTTQQLEQVLDRIIGEEEKRRSDDYSAK